MFQRACMMAILSFFAFAAVLPVKAHAAEGAPTVAVIDVEKILGEAKAAQGLQKQIQAKKEAFQKEFSAKEKELKAAETALVAEKSKLSAEEFAKKGKAYEEKVFEAQKLFKKRRSALDEGLKKAMADLHKSIVEAGTVVADKKDYDIVLTRDSVLIFDKGLDITGDVLKVLDEKTTDIKLTVE